MAMATAWISLGGRAHGLIHAPAVKTFETQRPDSFVINTRHCQYRYPWVGACSQDHDEGEYDQATRIPRRTFLRRVISVIVGAASTAARSPASSLDPQRDPRTAQPPQPALLLPVEKIRVAVTKLNMILEQPNHWEEALSTLNSPPFSEPEFRTVLDRYSDANWGVHILGDLYRNQGLESIKALKEIIAFSVEQRNQGVEISQQDIDDVIDAGRALTASVDKFASLAPQADLQLVQKLVGDFP